MKQVFTNFGYILVFLKCINPIHIGSSSFQMISEVVWISRTESASNEEEDLCDWSLSSDCHTPNYGEEAHQWNQNQRWFKKTDWWKWSTALTVFSVFKVKCNEYVMMLSGFRSSCVRRVSLRGNLEIPVCFHIVWAKNLNLSYLIMFLTPMTRIVDEAGCY